MLSTVSFMESRRCCAPFNRHSTTPRRSTDVLASRTHPITKSIQPGGFGMSLGFSHPLRCAGFVDSTNSACLPRPGAFNSASVNFPALVTTARNRYRPARCIRNSAVPRPSESIDPTHGPSAASMIEASTSSCPTPRRNRAALVRRASGVAVIWSQCMAPTIYPPRFDAGCASPSIRCPDVGTFQ